MQGTEVKFINVFDNMYIQIGTAAIAYFFLKS